MRLRSTIFLPPDGAGLDAALESPADAIALGLADSSLEVAALRAAAREALERIKAAGKKALVAVNHPRTRLLHDDLDAIVTADLAGVLLHHTVEPQDVRDLAVGLREFEHKRGIEPGTVLVYPVIDTARGLIRAVEIVQAAPRVGGLVFGAQHYARDVGARHEEKGPRLAYARGAVVAAARAFDRLPLITSEGLELQHLAQHGFAGAILPSANHAVTANAAFAPIAAAVERAHAHIEAYESARAEGSWVARHGSEMVDISHVRKARQAIL